MKPTRSSLHLIVWSAAAALSIGCSSADDTGGDTGGTGGSGQGASGGSAGTGVSGGTAGVGGSSGKGGSSGSAGSSGASAAGGSAGTAGSSGASGSAGASGASGASGAGGVAGASGAGAGGMSGGGGAGAGGMSGGAGQAGGGASGAGGGGKGGAGAGGAAGKGGAGGAGAGGASGGGAGGSGGMSPTSSGCGKAPGIASGMYNNGSTIAITAANMQRRYILNVPTNYDNTKPYKLIIAFHQLNGNDKQMYANGYYHLLNLSGNNAIFVAPNGQQNNNPCTGNGNGGESGCGWPNPNNSDIALADAVVDTIEKNFCIDTNRIFATGWSYGGSMSYKTACERGLGGTKGGVPGYVRAIAVYSGSQLSGNCTPTTPVAYFASHGTHDSVLNYNNGVGLAQNFAMANGCNWMTPTSVTSGQHVCTDEMGCDTGYPVKFCSFNGDHTPDPDNGQGGNSWVYQLVWDFFNQF